MAQLVTEGVFHIAARAREAVAPSVIEQVHVNMQAAAGLLRKRFGGEIRCNVQAPREGIYERFKPLHVSDNSFHILGRQERYFVLVEPDLGIHLGHGQACQSLLNLFNSRFLAGNGGHAGEIEFYLSRQHSRQFKIRS